MIKILAILFISLSIFGSLVQIETVEASIEICAAEV